MISNPRAASCSVIFRFNFAWIMCLNLPSLLFIEPVWILMSVLDNASSRFQWWYASSSTVFLNLHVAHNQVLLILFCKF